MTPKSVLICDDCDDVRDVLTCALQFFEIGVTGYRSADEALNDKSIDLSEFDAIVTDYDMPGTQGDVFALIMRALNPLSQIIVISSRHLPTEKDQLMNIEFLEKPFSVSQLIQQFKDFRRLQSGAQLPTLTNSTPTHLTGTHS